MKPGVRSSSVRTADSGVGAGPVAAWRRWLASWWQEFAVYGALDRDSAELRARHLAAINRLVPQLMVANLLNGLLVWAALYRQLPWHEGLLWLLVLSLCCVDALRRRWRQAGRRAPASASVRAIRRQVQGAVSLALVWAWAVVRWFPQADGGQRLLLGVLVVGMMCGGAFALATVPQAALAYMVVLAAAAVGAAVLGQEPLVLPLMALLAVYTAVLGWCVLSTARLATARLISEREAARQGQLVGLLLRDFEEHAADLLWETGPDGHLGHVSPRLAATLGLAPERLQHLTLLQALQRGQPDAPASGAGAAAERLSRTAPLVHTPPPRDAAGQPQGLAHLAALRSALAQDRAFRDLEVPVLTAGGWRWWSLTAKPLADERGRHAGWRGVISDVTEAREAHQRLARLAHHDPLTGLANRVRLREVLHQALAEAADGRKRCALVLLDVDHFKRINDTLGHAGGDAVLVTVAERLRANLRLGDLAARQGGDEFALLIDAAGSDDEVDALARRLTLALNRPCEVEGQQLALGISLGLAVAPDHGQDIDALMAHADLALYAAKEAGRGRYAVFVPRLGDRHRRRVTLERSLRTLLEATAGHGTAAAAGGLAPCIEVPDEVGRLQLHWQPRIAIDGWQVIGAEALLRWHHGTLGSVPPSEFIPIAEESGLIEALGQQVLARACMEALRLPAHLQVSVNVSPIQLRRAHFADSVLQELHASGLPAERLELEITESVFIADATLPLRHLHQLRQCGVQVALDDFGTGYSSLAYLRRFPFDTLKIDRAFVRELMSRHDARAIVQTIIELARTLGMHTLAEGVEEPAQLQLLREAGCEAIQGWLVARPMPLDELRRLLANWRPLAPDAGRAPLPTARDGEAGGLVLREVGATTRRQQG
ncbi:MAG: hypothetical protein RLY78_1910 [Pseudomonadota bacterium]